MKTVGIECSITPVGDGHTWQSGHMPRSRPAAPDAVAGRLGGALGEPYEPWLRARACR